MKSSLLIQILAFSFFCNLSIAQSYDLQFVVENSDGVNNGNFDVKIQIKATSSNFELGLSNLTFDYNTQGLYSGKAPDDEANAPEILTAYNFNSVDYDAMTLTEPNRGTLSLNINYAFLIPGSGTNVPTITWTDVATIRFVIRDNTQFSDLIWRQDQGDGGLNPVVINNDNLPADGITRNSVSGNSVALPVELIGFTATRKSNSIDLQWITGSEHENAGFDIERSLDGLNWNKIAHQKGAGNSLTSVDYFYSDKEIVAMNVSGKVYYRLKQINFNGNYEYSVIRSLSFNGEVQVAISAYPNPFTESIRFDYTGIEPGKIQIIAMNGEIMEEKVITQVGTTCRFEGLNRLKPGVYFVRMVSDTQIETLSLLKI